jgi:hypothetical protein
MLFLVPEAAGSYKFVARFTCLSVLIIANLYSVKGRSYSHLPVKGRMRAIISLPKRLFF